MIRFKSTFIRPSNPSSIIMRNLPALILFTFLLLGTLGYYNSTSKTRHISEARGSTAWSARHQPIRQLNVNSGSDHSQSYIHASTLLALATARLATLVFRYDAPREKEELGLNLGSLELGSYSAELTGVWKKWFDINRGDQVELESGQNTGWMTFLWSKSRTATVKDKTTKTSWILPFTQTKLSLLPQPAPLTSIPSFKSPHPFPQTIYTTSPSTLVQPHTDHTPGPDHPEHRLEFPEQFQSWAKENVDWEVRYFDDWGIENWLSEIFSDGGQVGLGVDGSRSISAPSAGTQVTAADEPLLPLIIKEYHSLPKGVLRADLFRYLILLIHGGIYTDTDTACVRPLSTWPGIDLRNKRYDTLGDAWLEVLPGLISLGSSVNTQTNSKQGEEPPTLPDVEDLYGDVPINMIISLEYSDLEGWKESPFVRGIQFVQWTIASTAGHPILLDTIGRSLRIAKSYRNGSIPNADEGLPDPLNWTGPGPFTDSVFRYLLARWGVHPREVIEREGPVRVGDVLIMPLDGFRADASEGDQGENKLVWHGFFGSWKGGT